PPDTLRSPTRSPPPPPRFPPPRSPPARSPAPADCLPAPRSIDPACCPLPLNWLWFWRAFACLLDMESPRAVPPNLLAVGLFPYGGSPACWGLCCQLLPARLPFRLAFPLTFCRLELFTKLLLLLIVISLFPPQPEFHPQPPPPHAAPI